MTRSKREQEWRDVGFEASIVRVELLKLYAERDCLEAFRRRLVAWEGYEAIRLAIVLTTIDRLQVYLHELTNPGDPN